MSWDDEKDALIKRMWTKDRASANDIAGKVGTTRNAVIGRLHRLGCNSSNGGSMNQPTKAERGMPPTIMPPPARAPAKKPVQQKVWNHWGNTPADAERKIVEPYREPPAGTPVPEVDPAKMVRTLDLEEHHCRWPIGDPRDSDTFRHCGKDKVMGQSYCEAHVRRAYAPRINATGPNFTAGGQIEIEAPLGGSETVADPEPNLEDA